MPERRESPRTSASEECTLFLKGRRVPARVEDLSDIGVRFQILSEDPRAVTDEDLGAQVSFTLLSTVPPRACLGELIRRYFEDGAQHVAVRLWRKCRDLPTSRS